LDTPEVIEEEDDRMEDQLLDMDFSF
jgi:hypothetical protein